MRLMRWYHSARQTGVLKSVTLRSLHVCEDESLITFCITYAHDSDGTELIGFCRLYLFGLVESYEVTRRQTRLFKH